MKKLVPSLVILLAVLGWILFQRYSGGDVGGDLREGEDMEVEAGLEDEGFVAGVRGRREVDRGEVYREARAYRLVLGGGVCDLEAVDELEGEFREDREMVAREGMFYCRLLGVDGSVLAETTMDAPDRQCVVLAPQDGEMVPMRMTGDGPFVFQVRLPVVEGAVSLEVVRLAREGVPDDGSRPLGDLVVTLDLKNL
jgi:hypothetical protein